MAQLPAMWRSFSVSQSDRPLLRDIWLPWSTPNRLDVDNCTTNEPRYHSTQSVLYFPDSSTPPQSSLYWVWFVLNQTQSFCFQKFFWRLDFLNARCQWMPFSSPSQQCPNTASTKLFITPTSTAVINRAHAHIRTHTHMHTHTFNGPLSGNTRVNRYQKGKTNLDFTEARDSEWHQLGHMQVCTLLQTDNHASTPPLSFFTGRMPFLPPNQQCQSTEGS